MRKAGAFTEALRVVDGPTEGGLDPDTGSRSDGADEKRDSGSRVESPPPITRHGDSKPQVAHPLSGAASSRGTPRAAEERIETLLGAFLVGTYGLELKERLFNLNDLPNDYRDLIEQARAEGRVWAAWSTSDGAVAASAEYDEPRSKEVHAHVMRIEWRCPTATGQHSLWVCCDPRRPTEWVAGRGDPYKSW